eukprot:gnl/TRDRNA2_/TRDRNA2_39814_c0_seq1.p1 gnl/TRDRNA2_/TRDRNA2_39814_c0~~gnl/TRDRNA2_/TRDRNA2_39814_c0_seq1.p1  ORF type:complete len:390 (-),score=68.80 gnl/TRDRNA2_/TRDRNA2_39814_c0_seq1:306-1475(-)
MMCHATSMVLLVMAVQSCAEEFAQHTGIKSFSNPDNKNDKSDNGSNEDMPESKEKLLHRALTTLTATALENTTVEKHRPPGAEATGEADSKKKPPDDCWEARTLDFPGCTGYVKHGYACTVDGSQCAAVRPGGTPDICAVKAPRGSVLDRKTGTCVQQPSAECWQARKRDFPTCTGYKTHGYTCTPDGLRCASLQPGGNPHACAQKVWGRFVVDAETGTCVQAGIGEAGGFACWQARTSDFPTCYGYESHGYSCTPDGSQCASLQPRGAYDMCAIKARPLFVVDAETGTCVPPAAVEAEAQVRLALLSWRKWRTASRAGEQKAALAAAKASTRKAAKAVQKSALSQMSFPVISILAVLLTTVFAGSGVVLAHRALVAVLRPQARTIPYM